MLFHPGDYENRTEALDLYAAIEDMTGVKEAAPELYAHYLLALRGMEFSKLLDIGCGSGDFISSLSEAFAGKEMKGIDLSPRMVKAAREKGVEASVRGICDTDGKYDVIVAVFDTLNYITPRKLGEFMSCLSERLEEGGVFMCDINTLYGFEEVANGAMTAEDEKRFLAIDSEYEDGIYRADFTLFIDTEKGCYRKEKGSIHQFYHTPESIAEAGGLELISKEDVSLYADEADKNFLIFRK